VVSVLPGLASGGLGYLWVFLLFVCYGYIFPFTSRYFRKARLDMDEDFAIFTNILSSCWLGLFVNCVLAKKTVKVHFGMMAAVGWSLFIWIVYVWVIDFFSPQLWVYGVVLAAVAAFTAILSLDADYMLKYRRDLYFVDDYGVAFVHFQTDIFFRFWWNMFTGSKKKIDSLTIEEVENNKV